METYKVLILLTGPSRILSMQAFARGLSGTEYSFFWRESEQAFVFENRDLSIEEFNRISIEIMGAKDHPYPIFARVVKVDQEPVIASNSESTESPEATASQPAKRTAKSMFASPKG